MAYFSAGVQSSLKSIYPNSASTQNANPSFRYCYIFLVSPKKTFCLAVTTCGPYG